MISPYIKFIGINTELSGTPNMFVLVKVNKLINSNPIVPGIHSRHFLVYSSHVVSHELYKLH